MKDPLNKRLTRELRKEWKKYFVVFFLMTFMIGVASGLDVANGSMLTAIDEAYDKYTVEDGHFELKEKATTELLDSLNDGITVYELFSKTVSEDPRDGQKDESTIKIFRIRKDLNKVCVMEGVLPSGKNEIAVDRMHADNRNIKVGDTIGINGEDYKVTGLIALPDYGCLFDDNSDIMFNAISFDVGVVTDEDYENIDVGECFEYAFRYDKKPADEKEEKEVSDKLAEKIAILCITGAYTSDKKEAEALDEKISKDPSFMLELAPYQDNVNELLDFVPSYANQAIQFAADDFGSDMAMMGVLVYIFIGVLAFVFAITTRNTIESEAAVIGTLRSTGYTRGELIRHYMLIPVTITILSAIVGNVLGYTYFKDVVVDIYYNSYSLLKY